MTGQGHITTGQQGENAACAYLESLGHTIVARNWRSAHKEVDIISLTGDELHFVEVKSRTSSSFAAPEVNVTRSKMSNIISAARAFLHSKAAQGLPRNLEVIFDVVAVVLESAKPQITYYPNAYKAIYV
ncbi:MAG: YraN family protein [Bacteroidales bacterium]|nr:YraN family protein [Bacteroidales bacterium]